MNRSRIITFAIFATLVAGFFLYAFWPRAMLVDLAEVSKGHMMQTIDEEAKTRVNDIYVVSTPTAGRLLRVEVEAGDKVEANTSIVARMMPTNPNLLDVRTEEQAIAAVAAGEAALELARAEAVRADADLALARSSRDRYAALVEQDAASRAAFDEAVRNLKAASAATRSAKAAIGMRQADLNSAKAMLMDFADANELSMTGNPYPAHSLPILSPINGVVLQLVHESETTLPVGADILHIGNPGADLEIVAELLSAEAVRVHQGDRVIIDGWGGDQSLEGVVETIEPWAFTKISALGIEEQRANVIIRFAGTEESYAGLGHGYRVYIRIVTWERPDATIVPSNTLFRNEGGWAVFSVVRGKARLQRVEVGQNNGLQAEILSGIAPGETVILYPSDEIEEGRHVKNRG